MGTLSDDALAAILHYHANRYWFYHHWRLGLVSKQWLRVMRRVPYDPHYHCLINRLSFDALVALADRLDWTSICCIHAMREWAIRRLHQHLPVEAWRAICVWPLSLNFIEEFQHQVDWCRVARYSQLSEEFIARHMHGHLLHLSTTVCKEQQLSPAFIERHADWINWRQILTRDDLPEDFKARHAWRRYVSFYTTG